MQRTTRLSRTTATVVFVIALAVMLVIPAAALAHHVMPYPEENSPNWEFIDSVAHGASVDNSVETGDNVSMGSAPGTITAEATMQGTGPENMILAGDENGTASTGDK